MDSVDYNSLLNSFKNGLKDSVMRIFNEAKLTPNQTVTLLEKVMNNLGDLWQAEKVPLTSLYVASRITEDIATGLFRDNPDTVPKRGVIVMGTIEEDYHSLGKNIVKRFLTPFFEVYDLGNDVPPKQFISKAREVSAQIIAVSTLMLNSVEFIHDLRSEIDNITWNQKPKLLVGGAPFVIDSELAGIVGADAFAGSAFESVQTCLDLIGGECDS
ncbi:MAG: cobalamin B12-binding domain-containing protein [Candidatus Thorarchaeota archaeon]